MIFGQGGIFIFSIIRCIECGNPQYVRRGQKSRICPRCHTRLNIVKLKIFDSTESIKEANELIRKLKTPPEYEQRIAALQSTQGLKSTSSPEILGRVISELLVTFPNVISKALLVEKAIAIGLDFPIIENILLQLHDAGLMVEKPVISSDPRGLLLKFPAVPFTFGKLHVSIPNGKSIHGNDS